MKKLLLLIFSFAFLSHIMAFADPAPSLKVEIREGGYKLHTFYKVKCPSGLHASPSTLVVEAVAGPNMGICKGIFHKPNYGASLEFRLKKIKCRLVATEQGGQISRWKDHIQSSSVWYPCLHNLLTKIYYKYDSTPPSRRNYSAPKYIKKGAAKLHVKKLPQCMLKSRYFLSIKDASVASHWVDVEIREEAVKGYKGKIKTAYVHGGKRAVKFAFTKDGLREVSSENNVASLCQSNKELAERGLKKFNKLKKLHKKSN